MKTKILFALFMSLVFLATNNASAYYCPATGRWLSRDPNGELGFETLRAASIVPKVGQIASAASLPPSRLANRDPIATKAEPDRYAFVKNDPESKVDFQGLFGYSTDYTWNPAPCGAGMKTAYIQVSWGASVLYNTPFVDDGKHGGRSDKPACPPLYPNGGAPVAGPGDDSSFEDQPSGNDPLLWGMTFEVCELCLKPCCGGYAIAHVGPCRTYTIPGKGGTVDLDDSSAHYDQPSPLYTQTINLFYPGVLKGKCIQCNK